MEQHEISPILATRLTGVYGDVGREWIARFPALLRRFRDEWAIAEVGPTFGYVGYAWVAPVTLAGGKAAVLKLAPPDKEFASEIEALRLYAGQGAARLLAADSAAVALLLERLEPGGTLAESGLDDGTATEIAALTFKKLYRPLPAAHPFPTVERWGQAFRRVRSRPEGPGAFPADLFEPADRLYFELCATQAEPVLLHGDLHHWNILSAGREPWLAIDPKGLAGEPAYEIGPLLYNRMDAGPDLRELTLRRIDQVAGILALDRRRLLLLGFSQAVLSALWTYEDHGEVSNDHLRLARALRTEI